MLEVGEDDGSRAELGGEEAAEPDTRAELEDARVGAPLGVSGEVVSEHDGGFPQARADAVAVRGLADENARAVEGELANRLGAGGGATRRESSLHGVARGAGEGPRAPTRASPRRSPREPRPRTSRRMSPSPRGSAQRARGDRRSARGHGPCPANPRRARPPPKRRTSPPRPRRRPRRTWVGRSGDANARERRWGRRATHRRLSMTSRSRSSRKARSTEKPRQNGRDLSNLGSKQAYVASSVGYQSAGGEVPDCFVTLIRR